MTIQDLIETLTLALEAGHVTEQTEVRLWQQPNYPLEYALAGIEVRDPGEYGDDYDDEPVEVIYLTEGSQVGYAPRHLMGLEERF